MRPIAVVRAGDAIPLNQEGRGESAAEDAVDELHPENRRAHRLELASDHTTGEPSRDRITPVQIPPPPGIPTDLVPAADQHTTALDEPRRDNGQSLKGDEPAARAEHSPTSNVAASSSSNVKSRRIPAFPKYSGATLVIAGVAVVVAILAALRGHDERMSRHAAQPEAALDTVVHTAKVSPQSNIAVAKQPEAPSAAPVASEPAPAVSADVTTTRVTLELMPIDAKVFSHGREVSGPPFEFDIVKGKRTAVEVKRPGYVTAKVVMDGTKPLVHFGMLREPAKGRSRAAEAAH